MWVQVDPSVSFDQVGGLEHYIKALKEMVFLPLVYPELFERFHMSPPRGVLFYGPPGMYCKETSLALCLLSFADLLQGCCPSQKSQGSARLRCVLSSAIPQLPGLAAAAAAAALMLHTLNSPAKHAVLLDHLCCRTWENCANNQARHVHRHGHASRPENAQAWSCKLT